LSENRDHELDQHEKNDVEKISESLKIRESINHERRQRKRRQRKRKHCEHRFK
jgi:hypothetical protein